METKTVKEWIATLHEPYRTQADLNTKSYNEKIICDNISEALLTAFSWKDTPQGFNYWVKFYELILNGLWQKN